MVKKVFTVEELAFMQNGRLFDQKEEITQRIQGLLAELGELFKARIKPEELCYPESTDFVHGQIVRGERFHQRPYVYLDFPKFFSRQAMFTYRSFFWWGWDFVFAWILSGPYLDHYKKNLVNHLEHMTGKGFYLSLSPNPWEWRKTSPDNLELTRQDPQEIQQLLLGKEFLKVQYFLGLDHPLWTEGGLLEEGAKIFDHLRIIVSR